MIVNIVSIVCFMDVASAAVVPVVLEFDVGVVTVAVVLSVISVSAVVCMMLVASISIVFVVRGASVFPVAAQGTPTVFAPSHCSAALLVCLDFFI